MNEWPNIDQLMKMAVDNPELLEQFRQREVAALIESAPEDIQRRLHGLQFQIDCQRELHKTPMGACIAISKMMHDSVNQLNALLNGGKNLPEEEDALSSGNDKLGRVIPFPA